MWSIYGKNALVATPDDMDAFAAKMQWALDYSDEARKFNERGRDVAFDYLTETRKLANAVAMNT